MKSILKRIIESITLIAISAALWQLILFPVANNLDKKLPLSLFQNFIIIFGIGLLIFLINWYAEKQGYLNWKEVWTALLAPLAEELVFRKILTKVIFPKNLKISLVITGIIFTAIHLPVSLGDWVNQLGAALVLSIIYYKTRKVEISIIVHSIMNLFITALMLWAMYS